MFGFGKKRNVNEKTNLRTSKESFELAIRYLNTGNIKEGMDQLMRLALGNYPDAEFELGKIYEEIYKNDMEAVKWFKLAAEHGHAQGQRNIADMYMVGKGVEKNENRAIDWYMKAALQGVAEAQFVLGEIFRNGASSLGRDLEKAKYWYNLAKENGFDLASTRLEQLNGSNQTSKSGNGVRVVTYDNPFKDAPVEQLMTTAIEYFIGERIPRDYAKGTKYLSAAAERGFADAQYMLGKMYQGGQGVEKDYPIAFKWLEKAALQDHADACFTVAVFYDNGIVVKKDRATANKYLKKAALLGNEQAIEIQKKRDIS